MHFKIQAYEGITNYLSSPPRSNPIKTSRNSSTPTTLLFVVNQDVDKLEESSQVVSSNKVMIDIPLPKYCICFQVGLFETTDLIKDTQSNSY